MTGKGLFKNNFITRSNSQACLVWFGNVVECASHREATVSAKYQYMNVLSEDTIYSTLIQRHLALGHRQHKI